MVCFTLLTSRKACTPWTHRLNEPSRWGTGTTAGAAHSPPSSHLSPHRHPHQVYSLFRLQEQSLKCKFDHVTSLLIAFGIKSKLLALPLGPGMSRSSSDLTEHQPPWPAFGSSNAPSSPPPWGLGAGWFLLPVTFFLQATDSLFPVFTSLFKATSSGKFPLTTLYRVVTFNK